MWEGKEGTFPEEEATAKARHESNGSGVRRGRDERMICSTNRHWASTFMSGPGLGVGVQL